MADGELEAGRILDEDPPGVMAAPPDEFAFHPGAMPTEFASPGFSQINRSAVTNTEHVGQGGAFTLRDGGARSRHAATPAESINSNGHERSPAAAYVPESRTPIARTKSLQEDFRTPEPNPQRTLSFSPQTPPLRASAAAPPLVIPTAPGNQDTFTPLHRVPSRTFGPAETPNMRKPPLPPQTPPQKQTPVAGGQREPPRTSSFPKSDGNTLEEAEGEGNAIASRGRRHSWDPSMSRDPLQRRQPSPQSRNRRSSFSESPPSGGAKTPGGTTPLRRAASAAPVLSPLLRSAARSGSSTDTSDSQYVPASSLKSRKSSWSEKDFRAVTADMSPEEGGRRASFPSSDQLRRGGSAESKLKVKILPGVRENRPLSPHSSWLDVNNGADFSPKTTKARRVTSAKQLRRGRRWRLTTILGLFAALLMVTSLLTHFWAAASVGPQLETMAANLREGFGGSVNEPPVQCVRSVESGGLACYVPAEEKQLRRDRGFGQRGRVRPMYERLLALAAHSLAELEWKPDALGPWAESPANGTWEICADQRGRDWAAPPLEGESNGYLLVSAEGGINQQRVAVCNAVALARHLNLTLVLPEFVSQGGDLHGSHFEDIFSPDHFKEYLRPDVRIVDRLPAELSELDLPGMGSVFDDSYFPREAPLRLYEEALLPVLRTNWVVLLRQFVNRLAFDPIPPEIQKLRCRVNFHALRFQPHIQAMGRLLIDRMRSSSSEYNSYKSKKPTQRDYWAPASVKSWLARDIGTETRLGRRALQSDGGDTRTGLEKAGQDWLLEQDSGREGFVVDAKAGTLVESERRVVASPEGEVDGPNVVMTVETRGGTMEGAPELRNGLETRSKETMGVGGSGRRRLLTSDEPADDVEDDISHLPETVQRYMRLQRLRDARKVREREESARARAHTAADAALRRDETLAVLERDEGMEVVHLASALVLDDDGSKGLAEKTRVAPGVGDEILVADPEKPGRAEKSRDRLGVASGGLEREEEERWPVRFAAVHANFPAKLAAFSMCDFGGGEEEKAELRQIRATHFESLARWERNGRAPDPKTQRKTGQCPLTPEEAVLMLAALSVKRRTRVYLTTAEVWGGADRLIPLRGLYPYSVTKEQLASPEELAPFRDSLPKLAALDFIVSSAADLFAMTDPGSQLSSLVTGMRMYHGRGKLPTLRPDKRQLAAALAEHRDVEWHVFVNKVKDSVMSSLGQTARKEGQSIYRHPRSAACMQFETALPLVTEAALSEQRTSVEELDRPINDTGLTHEVEKQEDAEMLAVELHARNSTLANGTSSFEVFEASQIAVEPLPTAPSTGELERD